MFSDNSTSVTMDDLRAQMEKRYARRLRDTCLVMERLDGDYGIHFHFPSWFKPWRHFQVGVVNNDEVGFEIEPYHFRALMKEHPQDWMGVMAILRRDNMEESTADAD